MSILLITSSVAEERARSEEPSAVDIVKVEDGEADGEASGGLVFDDTSEFVRGITYNPIAVKKETPAANGPTSSTPMKQASPDEDIPMEEAEELEAGEVEVKEEDDDDDAIYNAIENN